ncbi:prevent-host-death protein [Xanthomonas sp. LMG 8989]|nr:prevent-host-death protein [Xanthomonas sp. LMG 8989]
MVTTGSSVTNVQPSTLARANLSELADQAKTGADRLDYCHRLERERIHLLLLDDAKRGLADIAAGRTVDADAAIGQLQRRRAAIKTPDGVSPGKRAAKKRG